MSVVPGLRNRNEGVINVGLNVIFVTVLHLNVAGVALATTISQGVSATLVVIALLKRNDACQLHLIKSRLQTCIDLAVGRCFSFKLMTCHWTVC